MKHILKYVLMSIIAITVVLGGQVFVAPAANADDFNFTVTATSYDRASQSATIKNQKRLTINGAEQVTWENPNHGAKVTPTQLKRAPKISTSCTNSNRLTQSQQIYNKTHGARVVIVKAGSCLWNRGMRDQIRVGFKFKVTIPVVLSLDSNRRYRHSFTLKTKSQLQAGDTSIGKVYVLGATRYIVKSCWNFIGGPVDVVAPSVIQVRYQQDVKYNAELEVRSDVKANVTFNITCPNGANFNTTIEASAYGYARSEISFTERTRVSVVAAKRVTLNDSSWLHAEQEALSAAKVKVQVQGSCGDTPPPTYSAPSVSANAQACVEPGQATGIVTVTATNNNDVAVPATYAFPGKADQTATIAANATVAKQFTGVAPGSYTGTVSFGAPVNKTAQYNVVVEECEAPPHQNPTAEIFVGEHAVDLYGTMPVFGRVKAFDGATATLGSPVVNPSDLGMISNWRTVSTERDGVTPCAAGYVCYQGTFRVTKDGTPGTYVYGTLKATATDTKGGSFTTDPLQFSVYYANHPET